MDKIIVKSFDGKETKEYYYEDIAQATKKYEELNADMEIVDCELSIVIKTVLKAFNR